MTTSATLVRGETRTAVPIAAPPSADWRSVAGDAAWSGAAATFGHVIGATVSLLLRGMLSPAQMGVWQGLKLALSYANYANLGVAKGAAREFSVARGRGDLVAAERGWQFALAANLISSMAYGLALAAAGIAVGWFGEGPWKAVWAWGLVAMAPAVIVQRHVTFRVTMLRARREFDLAARFSVVEALATLAIACTAAWLGGVVGLIVGTMAAMLFSLVWLNRRRRERLAPAWDAAELRKLARIGAPLLMAGAAATLFRSLDKLCILTALDDREYQLGAYSLASLVFAQLYGIGTTLAGVMQPRYGEAFGRTGCRRSPARLAARASEPLAAIAALLAGASIVVAGPVLARLLPDYTAGLDAALWLAPGALALVLAIPPSQVLAATDRQGAALAGILLATATAALANVIVLRAGGGILGVAIATSSSYLGYFLLTAMQSFRQLDRSDRWRYVAVIGVVVFPVLASAAACEVWRPVCTASLTDGAFKLAIVAVTWGIVAWPVARRGGWHSAWKRGPA